MSEKTIFGKIIDKEIPANIVYEDDRCLVFHDINPQAPVHVLVIPKKEIPTLNDLEEADDELVGYLVRIASRLAREKFDLKDGYRLVINCGPHAGQTVFHIHFHLLGGRPMGWPPWPG